MSELTVEDNIASAILSRVDKDIAWYNSKATQAMTLHYGLSTLQIVAAGLVPVFALTPGMQPRYVAAILGAIAGIARGIDVLHKYYDHYGAWRFTANQLRQEKFAYTARIGPYDGVPDDRAAAKLLAGRTYDRRQEEILQWLSLHEKSRSTDDTPKR